VKGQAPVSDVHRLQSMLWVAFILS